MPTVVVLLAVLVVRIFIVARKPGVERTAWRWFGAACSLSAGGYAAMALGLPLTHPISIALFASSYPLIVVAQHHFLLTRTKSSQWGTWLDSAVVASVGIAILLSSIAAAGLAELSTAEVVVSVFFPTLSIVTLSACVFLCSLVRWRLPQQLLALISAQLFLVGADLGPLLERGAAANSGLAVRLGAVGYTIAIAATFADRRWIATEHDELRFSRVFALPWVGALAALSLLLWPTTPLGSRLAAGLAMVLVVLRLSLAYGQVRLAAQHRKEARTDELTSLPNRRAFVEQLRTTVAGGASCGVLLMDLDGFKEVNDSLGHHAGDHLLRALSARLSRVIAEERAEARLFRLGGDEFACIVSPADGLVTFAERLRYVASLPTVIEGQRIDQRMSIGTATCPVDTTEPEDLLRFADAAMYRAKQLQSGVVSHSSVIDGEHSVLKTLAIVREGLEREKFELYFQPQVRSADGSVYGVEALLRLWRNGEFVPAPLLIGAAKTAGLMSELTDYVIDRSVRAASSLHGEFPDLVMSFNVSPEDLSSGSLAERVAAAARRHRVSPSKLCVEVTEESLLEDPVEAALTVERLRAAGFGVSMDDFGVGFSSLTNLRMLNVSELKIDRGFAHGMTADLRTQALVVSIAELAHRLGATVLLEGVETEEELDLARTFGIDLLQGFVFSRALAISDLRPWIRQQEVRRHDFDASSIRLPTESSIRR